jgi:ABC-2 type transport system ATP-binding protein
LWRYLGELNRDGTTIVLTTHYLEEVERLCRNVAIVAKGKIVRRGPKEEFLDGDGIEGAYLAATGAVPDHIAAGAA